LTYVQLILSFCNKISVIQESLPKRVKDIKFQHFLIKIVLMAGYIITGYWVLPVKVVLASS